MYTRQRGIANFAFIAVLVLLLVAAAFAFMERDNSASLQRKLDTQAATLNTKNDELTQAQQSYSALASLVGLADIMPSGDNVPPDQAVIKDKVSAFLNATLKKIADSSKFTVPSSVYQVDAKTKSVTVTPGEPTSVLLYSVPADKTTNFVAALNPMASQFAFAANMAKSAVERLTTEVTNYNQRVKQCNDANQTAQTAYTKQVGELTNANSTLTGQNQTLQDQVTLDTTKISQLTTNVQTVKSTAQKNENSYKLKLSAFESALRNLKAKINLQLKEDPKDGDVLAVGEAYKTVFIDLGRADHLLNGTKFEVWRTGMGGVRENVALIQVTRVQDRMSEARIVRQMTPNVPITKGMAISNPFYDPHGHLRVYIYGELKTYNTDIARQRLAASGVDVARTLDDTVNVIVVGQPPVEQASGGEEMTPGQARVNREKALEQLLRTASSIGAVVVTEDVLKTFIQY